MLLRNEAIKNVHIVLYRFKLKDTMRKDKSHVCLEKFYGKQKFVLVVVLP